MSAAVSSPDRTPPAFREQLRFLGWSPDTLVEFRSIDPSDSGTKERCGIVVGVTDVDAAFAAVPHVTGIYVLSARWKRSVPNKLTRRKWERLSTGEGCKDADVTHRDVLAIDCDALRPDKKLSATEEEKNAARKVAAAVRSDLARLGVPDGAMADVDSGNGAHVWIALDGLPNDEATKAAAQRILRGLAARFDCDAVEIDQTVFSAGQLLPACGTWKRKGSNTPERPHRLTSIVAPSKVHRLTLDELNALADRFPPERMPDRKGEKDPDLARAKFDVDVCRVLASLGMGDHECPRGHTSGADRWQNAVKCFHDSCSDVGPPGFPGLYSTVDLYQEKRGGDLLAARDAVLKIGGLSPTAPPRVLGGLAARIARLGNVGVRLATGFPTFDAACRGGLPMQRLIVVGGAPGAAKTSTVAQWGLRWARTGVPVAFLAADEEADGILTRWGQASGFTLDALEAGSEETRAALTAKLAGLPLDLVDSEDADDPITIERVSRELRALRGDGKASVLIVDSLQMASADGTGKIDNPRERIDAVVRACKRAAKRDGHLVIVTSELARGAYRDTNTINPLAAFKESGSIEYGVGTALVLRTVDGSTNLVDVEIPKNRIGRSADAKRPFRLAMDHRTCTLREVDLPAECLSDPADRRESLRETILKAVDAETFASKTAIYAWLKDRGEASRKDITLAEIGNMIAADIIGKGPNGRIVRIPSNVECIEPEF